MARKKKISSSTHGSFFQSLGLVVLSLIAALLLYQLGLFHTIIHSVNDLGYIGAFLGGMLFVSVFTAAPAAVLILTLGESLPFVPLAIIAGLGAVVGDMIILSLFSEGINDMISFLPSDGGVQKIVKTLRHSKYRFFLTILGAFVIASPLPDELGLALMGFSRVNRVMTAVITFTLNALGIYVFLLICATK